MTETIGPYQILRRLGAGGMGEVYLAQDPRLQRLVALKRPSDEWLNVPNAAERLQREARAAAGLSHPNIATIYDVLNVDGRPHIVMEYVEGDTLQHAVRGGGLPAGRVLDIGVQLADALGEAHSHGIVHRDLKPGNIMLTSSGRIKVLDFGLARTMSASGPRDAAITEAGQILGTPGYMAPEQLLGQSSDERSDIYSAGIVLFELLTGHPPFVAPDALGRALAALEQDGAPRADGLNPSVPKEVADVIERAVARRPEQRFHTTTEFRDALIRARASLSELPTVNAADTAASATRSLRRRRWPAIAAAIAVVGIVVAAIGWFSRHGRPAPAAASSVAPVVAVLPFEVISSDSATDYLGVGFADSLVTELARLHDVTVVRHDEVRGFVGDKRTVAGVARAVGANLIVDASLQVNGSTLHVNVKVMRADGDKVSNLGSQPYEGNLSQLFDLQRQIADGVIAAVSLGADAKPTTEQAGTSNLSALTNYWQGRALLDRDDVSGNAVKAIEAFEKALGEDQSFVTARAAIGEAAYKLYATTKDRKWYERALAESEKAFKQKPSDAQAATSLARVYKQDGRIDEAIETLKHVIRIDPNNDNAHEVLGDTLIGANRTEEGLAELRTAIAQRPRFAGHHTRLGIAYYNLGKYDDAVKELVTVTELQPDNARAFHQLGSVYQAIGDKRRAVEAYASAIRIGPLAETQSNMGVIQFEEGQYREAAASFEESVRMRPNNPQYRRNLGDAYWRLNQVDKARTAYLSCVTLSEELLKVNARDADAISQAAVCLAKVGRFDEAERRARQAVDLAPKYGRWLYRQAVVWSFAGKTREALSALDLALTNGYSSKLAAGDSDLEGIQGLPEFQAILRKYTK